MVEPVPDPRQRHFWTDTIFPVLAATHQVNRVVALAVSATEMVEFGRFYEDKPEDWDDPSGLRIGTIEVMRLGMNEGDMETIADFIARVLIEGEDPEAVGNNVMDFRAPKQTLYYNFDHDYPAWAKA